MSSKKYSAVFLNNMEENPLKMIKTMDITEFEQFLIDSSKYYYNTDKPLISDKTYDLLIDYLKEIKPKSCILNRIGAQPIIESLKVKLPYHLGSMNKIKPGSRKMEIWLNNYKGPYMVSDKLDGLSGLLVYKYKDKKIQKKMYTRGNGTYGQDITHLLPYINYGDDKKIKLYLENLNKELEKYKKIVVRGEIVIKEKKYENKYKDKYPKSRSFVSGNVNSKPSKIDKEKVKDLDFVSYQLIHPDNIYSNEQFKLLKKIGFNVVNNEYYENIPNLSKILLERRSKSEYKIDGIIISDDSKIYKNPSHGNPKHSVAFKMIFDDQQLNTTIRDIEYNISKNGILKPRIRYDPIKIDGDMMTYTTGFNAKYIKDNKLGPGAKIKIIRSGDVIPYIKEIIKSADKWSEPLVKYKWSENNVDAIALDLDGKEYLSKKLLHFFDTFNVEGMKIGTINKLIKGGFETIEVLLELEPMNLLGIAGFNLKLSQKIIDSIKTNILNKKHELETVMTASNIFKGFGIKKLKLIRQYLVNTGKKLNDLSIDDIITIPGFNTKTANYIVKNIPDFIDWHSTLPNIKIINYNYVKKEKNVNVLNNKNIVLTGFRDKELSKKIEDLGGNIQASINKNTSILIIKDSSISHGNKYNKAKSLNIDIMTNKEFYDYLNNQIKHKYEGSPVSA